jgi:murein DD-endopeptidase MepM/ murein hydrolase activator NlpD
VRAAAPGEVVYTGDNVAGFGNLVLIRHSGGFATAYGHIQKPLVKRGDHVTAGQSIAQIGKTGNVATPQLHFEIRKGTLAVDPKPYLP